MHCRNVSASFLALCGGLLLIVFGHILSPALVQAALATNDTEGAHWSFLPLQHPVVPEVQSTSKVRTPVDRFILERLESKGLTLSSPAEPRILARRIYFDLIGLPPTSTQMHNFENAYQADATQAVASLVDQLLDSPQYGERWARHWLDVVRYADSDGQESDADRPTAYHFRDFVIDSLNEDLPFDVFVRWQLAGDELEPDNPRAVAATGFIAAGTHAALPDNLMEEERIRTRYNELDDMIATTGSALLGLTLACARCHDHKYDPVPQRDYYRLLNAFNGGDRAELPLAPLAEVRAHREATAQWQTAFDEAKQRRDDWIKAARKTHEAAARNAKIEALQIDDAQKELLREQSQSQEAGVLTKKFAKELKVLDKDLQPFLTPEAQAEWESLEKSLQAVQAQQPKPLPTAFGFADFGPEPRATYFLVRGDFHAQREPLELGFLTSLTHGKRPEDYWASARANARRADSTQQRRALAEWITDLEHGPGALVARVLVNRVWQHHFGQGLVRTVNDFGARCDPPTHPELLEWLTSEFVRGGWKLKALHRLIMTSSVYLQDTTFHSASAEVDPDNRLWWRRRPLRLEAEILRDAMLSVSGTLNPAMFGPAVKGPIPSEAIQARNMKNPYPKDIADTPATRRRSVYLFHKRVVQHPLMQAFDGPDASASCGRRENTTVAPQALALLNDPFVRARAQDFAERIQREAGSALESQIRHTWLLGLGRTPSPEELASAIDYVRSQQARRAERHPTGSETEAPFQALADLCQAVFALNEFIYVD